ncbi:hypothetical protein [Kibdelosporangium phytohabitans]|uniref:Uncharacterized protein n=1 Tax=Kibdelosporangium phytohabitans TaxID=860235 RepID=A0A0N7F4N0_9PSEU|nr:hypothetical protein [Kibdelosporangium phytohabitans]ALG11887.1 hypothetical protein AOZ06_37955 [Kibdelosporangium phytohabitans]MBE1463328.1 hypothetical protein [Kibdelosporangium phytohabitans]
MRRYLRPQTDVPAIDDWSTALILNENRAMAPIVFCVWVVLTATALGIAIFLPGSAGNIATVVVLGLVCVLTSLNLLNVVVESRPARQGRLDAPWRRCSATVAVLDDDDWFQRLLVFDEPETLLLRGTALDGALDLVLDQQEVFLCGPDEKDRVIIRVPGLCQLYHAEVDPSLSAAEVRPMEREPYTSTRPLDDPAVAHASRYFRWGTRQWIWPVIFGGLGCVLTGLSIWPLSIAGLVTGGLMLLVAGFTTTLTMLTPLYREAVAGLESAEQWTTVPFTLFPWEPAQEVAGLAQLPGGGMALVVFPFPDSVLIANIADTGTLWFAGSLTKQAVAVGIPRISVLTLAVVQRDRDKPEDKPQPWLLRGNEPSLRRIPVLNR